MVRAGTRPRADRVVLRTTPEDVDFPAAQAQRAALDAVGAAVLRSAALAAMAGGGCRRCEAGEQRISRAGAAVPVQGHGRVHKRGVIGRLDVLFGEGAGLCTGGGGGAAVVDSDEARAVCADEAGGEAGDAVGWEVGGEELEECSGFSAGGAQGADILCPYRVAERDACEGERGGSGGGEKEGDVLDDLGGEEAEEGVGEGRWGRLLATDEGDHC